MGGGEKVTESLQSSILLCESDEQVIAVSVLHSGPIYAEVT